MAVRLPEENSPLLVALMEKRVKAETIDMDHFRIRGGMAVETDYIIQVETKGNTSLSMPDFESFTLSKTYSAFRTLAQQLKKAADTTTSSSGQLPKSVQKLAQYCETVHQLVESQRTQYLGKVNYNYVKALAKKRIHIVNEILETTLSYFPDEIESHKFHKEVAQAIETFFLLDHCVEDSSPDNSGHRRPRSLSGGGSRSSKLPKKESSEKKLRGLTVQAIGEPLVEPLVTVGHAVGTAVDTVGTFFKDRIIEITTKTTPAAATTAEKPPPIDTSLRSPVVPYTRKTRMSIVQRDISEKELTEMGEEANLLLDDERPPTEFVPSYSHPLPTFGSPGSKLGDLLETNPIMFLGIFLVTIAFLKYVAKFSVTMDLDILLLLIWASFCIGLHTPRPMVGGIDKSATPLAKLTTPKAAARPMRKQDRHGTQLLRMSMASTPDAAAATAAKMADEFSLNASSIHSLHEIREEDDDDSIMAAGQSPLPRFPFGAPLGSKNNCWSEPDYETFQVRGANYLSDKVKEASGPFIFPIRAVDLFLTDNCPENAGSNSGILGGRLREKPTFIINFRLPWGLFLAYFEIPERFIPFVRAAHEEGFDKSNLPSLDTMSPSDRCVARFCQDPPSEKNKKLKIVPVVVEGPWVVKSVVGGKPAIIGNKLPVDYHYSPASEKKALYLEADLDIVASSAARGILSVTRTYTQVLTIDLGFVVQGNTADELPEQMLVGARLHGIDPITAPPYPLSGDNLMHTITDGDDSSDE